MGRIDIVVFPGGGAEIFGRIGDASAERVSAVIQNFLAALEASGKPRKFTGYYDAADASDIEWLAYDENNPIVMVPKEPEEPMVLDGDENIDRYLAGPVYEPMPI